MLTQQDEPGCEHQRLPIRAGTRGKLQWLLADSANWVYVTHLRRHNIEAYASVQHAGLMHGK